MSPGVYGLIVGIKHQHPRLAELQVDPVTFSGLKTTALTEMRYYVGEIDMTKVWFYNRDRVIVYGCKVTAKDQA